MHRRAVTPVHRVNRSDAVDSLARARLGGTLVRLTVAEGDAVAQGDVLAEIVDEKLGFQLAALEARLSSNRQAYAKRPRTVFDREKEEVWEISLSQAIQLAIQNNSIILRMILKDEITGCQQQNC